MTPACTRLAAALYRQVTSTSSRFDPRVAETAKLLEIPSGASTSRSPTSWRSLAARLASTLGIIDAAATKPFASCPLPGRGSADTAPGRPSVPVLEGTLAGMRAVHRSPIRSIGPCRCTSWPWWGMA